jgi:hypothetical protein
VVLVLLFGANRAISAGEQRLGRVLLGLGGGLRLGCLIAATRRSAAWGPLSGELPFFGAFAIDPLLKTIRRWWAR